MDTNEQVQFSETSTTLLGEDTSEVLTENTSPQGLTKSDILEMMEANNQKVARETAKAFRAQQSMTDKKAKQVATQAQANIEAMKATGAQFTPEMERDFVNRTVNQYIGSFEDESPEPAQAQNTTGAVSQELVDAAMVRVDRIAKRLEVTVGKAEANELNKLWAFVKDPQTYNDFIDAAEDYLQAKAKNDKTPAQARIASLAGGVGTFTKSKDALTAELQKLLENPQAKNLPRIREIKEKLNT